MLDLAERPRSVVRSKDSEILLGLLAMHARPEPVILDCTFGRGVMWKGTGIVPTFRTDDKQALLEAGLTTHQARFDALPFEDGSLDVIVFDPPHLTEIGKGSRLNAGDRYGLDSQAVQHVKNISDLFPPFLAEAKRLLRRPGGIILAKVADQVHRNRAEWHQVDFVNACRAAGLTPCDQVIKWPTSGGTITGHNWARVLHHRKVHSYWIVVRVGRSCHRPSDFEPITP